MGAHKPKHVHVTLRFFSELEKIHSPLHSAVYSKMNMNEDFGKSQIPVSAKMLT